MVEMAQVERRYYLYRERDREPNKKNWTVEEDVRLLELRSEGKTHEEMATFLNRSKIAVSSRLRRLKAPKPDKEQRHSRCQRCGGSCVKDNEFVYCVDCAWEPEESKGVIIIG